MTNPRGQVLASLCVALYFTSAVFAHAKTAHAFGAEAQPVTAAPNEADSKAAQAIWHQHQRDMCDSLSASKSPRDWMLAALIGPSLAGRIEQQKQSQLLARAADAAPDDALVQWAAMSALGSNRDPALVATADQALQRLKNMEPDNAVVWLQDLNAAAKAKDPVGVDAALQRMAASSRVDVHYADLLKALVEAYQRDPLPPEYSEPAANQEYPETVVSIPYVAAIAITSAVALPAYSYLMRACAVDSSTGQHTWRAQDCATVGRLLAAKGDTFLSNRVGYTLLRVSKTYTGQDVAHARVLDWLLDQQRAMYVKPNLLTDQRIIASVADWIVSGSETEAIRYALARQGTRLTPPADWVDKASPFSAKRLRADKNRMAERVARSY